MNANSLRRLKSRHYVIWWVASLGSSGTFGRSQICGKAHENSQWVEEKNLLHVTSAHKTFFVRHFFKYGCHFSVHTRKKEWMKKIRNKKYEIITSNECKCNVFARIHTKIPGRLDLSAKWEIKSKKKTFRESFLCVVVCVPTYTHVHNPAFAFCMLFEGVSGLIICHSSYLKEKKVGKVFPINFTRGLEKKWKVIQVTFNTVITTIKTSLSCTSTTNHLKKSSICY